MKLCLWILVMFLIMTDVAWGAVGGSSVSDGSSSIQSAQAYSTGTSGNTLAGAGASGTGSGSSSSLGASVGAYVPIQTESYQPVSSGSGSSSGGSYQDDLYKDGYSYSQGGQSSQASSSAQTLASSAPQIIGPYQESMSPDDLKLSLPQADTFRPDSDLGFVSATLPSNLNANLNTNSNGNLNANLNSLETGANAAAYGSTYGATQSTAAGSSYWYYPGSIRSPNRFYVQTYSGLRTVGGCSFGGYLPLWADINSGGNLFVYEWYPGSSTPTAQWWGWSWTGFKKGWFYGDVPGWHILVYNCRDWSNYIYVYVYPTNAYSNDGYSNVAGQSSPYSSYPNGYAGTAYSGTGMAASPYSAGYASGAEAGGAAWTASGYTGNVGTVSQTALPSGAPTPPSPSSESITLPDYSTYTPYTGQAVQASYSAYPAQTTATIPVAMSGAASGYPGYSAKGCTTCSGSAGSTMTTTGVSGSYPSQGNCPTCASASGLTAPYGYVPQSYQAVYPRPSTCRCNEYFVQYYPNKISTVAGMYCGEWLPLWSKISRPGVYWSYEWTCSGSGYYSSPEVRNFGYKGSGWYQTWFSSSTPGWHILSYYCNDWSNYIYIYVWPTS